LSILAPVSVGELIDKITILELKLARMSDPAKRHNVATEHRALSAVLDTFRPLTGEVETLVAGLAEVNARLWDIEDEIRACERARDFGARFIELARAVYITNDRRAELKKQINLALGSELQEEKAYAAY